ncbi:hypothetical protein Hanom_Chr09g00833631 [Helianthus anomalus]
MGLCFFVRWLTWDGCFGQMELKVYVFRCTGIGLDRIRGKETDGVIWILVPF